MTEGMAISSNDCTEHTVHIPQSGPLVAETSVQTDMLDLIPCSTTETQTCNVTAFCPDDIFFEFGVSDIETQTIWNNDETTQTDDVLDDLMLGFDLLADPE